jgi:lipid II:glycine glycyltransferase (peptidoglycan interpeptide bridge formation enzyme)
MIKILSFTQYKETYIDRQPNIHSDSDWDFFVALETNQNQIETNQNQIEPNQNQIETNQNQIDIKPYICDYLTNATFVCFVLFMLF